MLKPQTENCASWTADCLEMEMPDPPKPNTQTTGSTGSSMPGPGDDCLDCPPGT